MCSQKNSKALAVSTGGGVFERELPDQRAACLSSDADAARDVSLSWVSGSPNGVADADSRDCADAGSLRISQDSGVAPSRGLEGRKDVGAAAVSRGRIGAETQAETPPAGSGAAPGADANHGGEPGLEFGFCGGPVSGWAALRASEP
jgi:hypothetical protein